MVRGILFLVKDCIGFKDWQPDEAHTSQIPKLPSGASLPYRPGWVLSIWGGAA